MKAQVEPVDKNALGERDRVLMSDLFREFLQKIDTSDDRAALVRQIESSSTSNVYRIVNERIKHHFDALQENKQLQEFKHLRRLLPPKGEGEVRDIDNGGIDIVDVWIQPSSVRKFLQNTVEDAISLRFFRCFLVAFSIPLEDWEQYYVKASKDDTFNQEKPETTKTQETGNVTSGWKTLLSVFSLFHKEPKLMDSKLVHYLKLRRQKFNGIGFDELFKELRKALPKIKVKRSKQRKYLEEDTGIILFNLEDNYDFLKGFFEGHHWYSFSRILADPRKIAIASMSFSFDDGRGTCKVDYFRREGNQQIQLEGGLRYRNGHLFILLRDVMGFKFVTMEMDKVMDKTLHGYACTEHHSTETSVKEIFFGLDAEDDLLNQQTSMYVEQGYMPYEYFRDYEGLLAEDKFGITNRRNSVLRYPSQSRDLFERFSAFKFCGNYVVVSKHPYEPGTYILGLLHIDALTVTHLKTVSVDFPDHFIAYRGHATLLNMNSLIQISLQRETSNKMEVRKGEMMLEIIKRDTGKGQKEICFRGKAVYVHDDSILSQTFVAFKHEELSQQFEDALPESFFFDAKQEMFETISTSCAHCFNESLVQLV